MEAGKFSTSTVWLVAKGHPSCRWCGAGRDRRVFIWVGVAGGPEDEARWACHDAAKHEVGDRLAESLDLPGAEFSGETVNATGEESWRVTGTVDIDAARGETVSASYECAVQNAEVMNVQVDLDMSPEEACRNAVQRQAAAEVRKPMNLLDAEFMGETVNEAGENRWSVTGTVEVDTRGGEAVSAGYECTVTEAEVIDVKLDVTG